MAKRYADHELIVSQASADALQIIKTFYPAARVAGHDIRWSLSGNGKGDGCSFSTSKHVFTPFSGGGQSTDIVGFVAFALGTSGDRLAAFDWLRNRGYGNAGAAPDPAITQEIKRARLEEERELAESTEEARNEAALIYTEAGVIDGTPALTYFGARGGDVLNIPENLRYHNSLERERGGGRALVMPIENGQGFCGIHYILLTEHGEKRKIKVPKRSRGSVAGGAMRFGAPPAERLYVCGGPEKAWALLQLLESGAAVWSVAGESNFAKIELPDVVRELVIMGDADDPGRMYAEQLASRMPLEGRTARCVFPAVEDQDWDDLLAAARAGSGEDIWQLEVDIAQMIEAAEVWRPEPKEELNGPGSPASMGVERLAKSLPEPGVMGSGPEPNDARAAIQPQEDTAVLRKETAMPLLEDNDQPSKKRKAKPTRNFNINEEGIEPADYWGTNLPDGKGLIPSLQRAWVYITPMAVFCPIDADRGNPLFLNESHFHNKFAHLAADSLKRKGKLAEALLTDHKTIKVDGLAFKPGKPRLVMSLGRFSLNLWARDARPETPTEPQPEPQQWLDLQEHSLLTGYQHRDEKDCMLLAVDNRYGWIRQCPGQKMHTAIYWLGAAGTGKSSALEVAMCLVGQPNTADVSITSFDTQFTDSYVMSELVIIDEVAKGRRDTGRESRLKRLITSRRMPYEGKGTKQIPVECDGNVVMAGNPTDAIDWRDDRRIVPLLAEKSPDEDQEVKKYVDAFADWWGDTITAEGRTKRQKAVAQLLYYYSQPQRIAGFNPAERAPLSSVKRTLVESARPEAERELERRLLEKLTPFEADCVNIEQVIDVFRRETDYRITVESVRKLLKKHGALPHTTASVWIKFEYFQRGFYKTITVQRRVWVVRHMAEYIRKEKTTSWVQDHVKLMDDDKIVQSKEEEAAERAARSEAKSDDADNVLPFKSPTPAKEVRTEDDEAAEPS